MQWVWIEGGGRESQGASCAWPARLDSPRRWWLSWELISEEQLALHEEGSSQGARGRSGQLWPGPLCGQVKSGPKRNHWITKGGHWCLQSSIWGKSRGTGREHRGSWVEIATMSKASRGIRGRPGEDGPGCLGDGTSSLLFVLRADKELPSQCLSCSLESRGTRTLFLPFLS